MPSPQLAAPGAESLSLPPPSWTPLRSNAWNTESQGPTPGQKAPPKVVHSPDDEQENSIATLLESPVVPMAAFHRGGSPSLEWTDSMITPLRNLPAAEDSEDLVGTIPYNPTPFPSVPPSPPPVASLRCHEVLNFDSENGPEIRVEAVTASQHQEEHERDAELTSLPEEATAPNNQVIELLVAKAKSADLPLSASAEQQQASSSRLAAYSPLQDTPAAGASSPRPVPAQSAAEASSSQPQSSPLLFSQHSLPPSTSRQGFGKPNNQWRSPAIVGPPTSPLPTSPRLGSQLVAPRSPDTQRKEAQGRLAKLDASVSQWSQRLQRSASASQSPDKVRRVPTPDEVAGVPTSAEGLAPACTTRFTSRMTPMATLQPATKNSQAARQQRTVAKLANLSQFMQRHEQVISQPHLAIPAAPAERDPASRLAHFDELLLNGQLFENDNDEEDEGASDVEGNAVYAPPTITPAAPPVSLSILTGFKTASDKSILLSEKAKRKGSDFQRRLVEHGTAAETDGVVPSVSMASSFFSEPLSSMGGFRTASDRPVIISAVGKRRAAEFKQALTADDQPTSALLANSSMLTASTVLDRDMRLPLNWVSADCGLPAMGVCLPLLEDNETSCALPARLTTTGHGGFMTASNKGITLSAAAQQKAREFERQLGVQVSPGIAAAPDARVAHGFQTASNKSISLSAAAQQKAIDFQQRLVAESGPRNGGSAVPASAACIGAPELSGQPNVPEGQSGGNLPTAKQKRLEFERQLAQDLTFQEAAALASVANTPTQNTGSFFKTASDKTVTFSASAQRRATDFQRQLAGNSPLLVSPLTTSVVSPYTLPTTVTANATPAHTPLHPSRNGPVIPRRPLPKFTSPVATGSAGKATSVSKRLGKSTPFRPPRVAAPARASSPAVVSAAHELHGNAKGAEAAPLPPVHPLAQMAPPRLYQQRVLQPRISMADFARQHDQRDHTSHFTLPPVLQHLSASNATVFRWSARLLHDLGASLQYDESGQQIVAGADGSVGLDELYHSFTAIPGVQVQYATLSWVTNHFRWILWKLAALARRFPAMCRSWYTPVRVLEELQYRYYREYISAERSALMRVLQKDEFAHRYMVLCVGAVCGPSTVLLTDGWYAVHAELDAGLSELLADQRLFVGLKLCVQGARLSSEQAVSPLECPDTTRLLLHLNGTRRARPYVRLGHQSCKKFPVPLRSLKAGGGDVALTEFVVLRQYPLQYMETHADKSKSFRNERAERLADQRWQERCEREVHSRSALLLEAMGESPARSPKKLQLSLEAVSELGSGQAVWEALENALDPEWVKSSLSPAQLVALEQHQTAVRDQRVAEARNELMEVAGVAPRVVTSMAKFRIADIVLPLFTMEFAQWRPDATLLAHLTEGCVIQACNLNVSQRPGFRAAELSLNGMRGSKLIPRKPIVPLPDDLFVPRSCHAFSSIARLQGGEEFDTVGLVVEVGPVRQSTAGPVQEMILVDQNCRRLCITFWGGIDEVAINKQALVSGAAVALLNLRFRSYDAPEHLSRATFTKEACLLSTCKESYLERPRQHLEGLAQRSDLLRQARQPAQSTAQWARPRPVSRPGKVRRPALVPLRPVQPALSKAVAAKPAIVSAKLVGRRQGYLCPGIVHVVQHADLSVLVSINAASFTSSPSPGGAHNKASCSVEKMTVPVWTCPVCLGELAMEPEEGQAHIEECLSLQERQRSLRKRKLASQPEPSSQKSIKSRKSRSSSHRCPARPAVCMRHSDGSSVHSVPEVLVKGTGFYTLLCHLDDSMEVMPVVIPCDLVGSALDGCPGKLQELLATGVVGDEVHPVLAPLRRRFLEQQSITTPGQLLELVFTTTLVVNDDGNELDTILDGGQEPPCGAVLRELTACDRCSAAVPDAGCLVFTLVEWGLLMDIFVQQLCYRHARITFADQPFPQQPLVARTLQLPATSVLVSELLVTMA